MSIQYSDFVPSNTELVEKMFADMEFKAWRQNFYGGRKNVPTQYLLNAYFSWVKDGRVTALAGC